MRTWLPLRQSSRQSRIRAYHLEMLYLNSESEWLDRRAKRIAGERGWTLPIARSEAEAELARSRLGGRSAVVIRFPPATYQPAGRPSD